MDASHLLSEAEIYKTLQARQSQWKVRKQDGIPRLCRKYTARNFQAALDSINAMGKIAERENHHPDFHLTNYRDVEVVIYTHKLQGLTENDLTLVRMLDEEVEIDYSPKWLKEYQASKGNDLK